MPMQKLRKQLYMGAAKRFYPNRYGAALMKSYKKFLPLALVAAAIMPVRP